MGKKLEQAWKMLFQFIAMCVVTLLVFYGCEYVVWNVASGGTTP